MMEEVLKGIDGVDVFKDVISTGDRIVGPRAEHTFYGVKDGKALVTGHRGTPETVSIDYILGMLNGGAQVVPRLKEFTATYQDKLNPDDNFALDIQGHPWLIPKAQAKEIFNELGRLLKEEKDEVMRLGNGTFGVNNGCQGPG
jgi:hypothetical protein